MAANSAKGILIFPNLKVQNTNIISSPLTWGFPSITAFMGLMWAFERKVATFCESIMFKSVGVVCHSFEPLVTKVGYNNFFNLTRNPLKIDKPSPISEEGRGSMEVTVIFEINGAVLSLSKLDQSKLLDQMNRVFRSMRIAGGSIVGSNTVKLPYIVQLDEDSERREVQFRKLARRWLPGSCLVMRQDLLNLKLKELQDSAAGGDLIDAFLESSRITWFAQEAVPNEAGGSSKANASWRLKEKVGWIVPISIGYTAISELYDPGVVENSRDSNTPFRFVESAFTLGEWISPHKLSKIDDLLWYNSVDPDSGLYTCSNDYAREILPLTV